MTKVIGIGTLLMVSISVTMGLIVIWIDSAFWGFVYATILIIGSTVIIFSYCTKCPAATNNCAHYFPGELVRRMPSRVQREYKMPDYLGLIIPIMLIFMFPLPWLWQSEYMLITFWLINIAAIVLIRTKLCRICENKFCYMCTNCSVLEQ